VAAVRLHDVEEEFGRDCEIQWRSYLLRPEPQSVQLGNFIQYTEGWKRPAAMEPRTTFRVWATEEGPPTHSIPPHIAAKIAEKLGPEPFSKMHERLLRAYFSENRDITDWKVLQELWEELGLPLEALSEKDDKTLVTKIIAEHNEALQYGTTGVPAVRLDGESAILVGAQDTDVYRRFIQKTVNDRLV